MELSAYISKNPNIKQSNALSGILKGIVVDVDDPCCLGRVKVWSYPIHGDMAGLCIADLPWCEVIQPIRGGFTPPELNDRVAISFEAQSKYHPIVIGYWNAIPTGRGGMAYSSKEGSEVRPEVRHRKGLYPEATMLGSSGAGNAIWYEDKLLGDNLASAITIEDTGGKMVRTKSYHRDCKGYAAIRAYDGKRGGMSDGTSEPNKPVRTGMGPAPQVAGSVELANHNTVRTLRTSADKFSSDSLLQVDSNGDIGITQHNVSGEMHRTRQGIASLSLSGNVATLMARAVVAMPLLSPPRIW